jgi:hypothetical protein
LRAMAWCTNDRSLSRAVVRREPGCSHWLVTLGQLRFPSLVLR